MERQVEAVPEVPVRMWVNGTPVAVWTCSPGGLETLAAGRLLSMGCIRSREDLLELRVGEGLIEARVPPDRLTAALEERRHRLEHGCGPRFLLRCGRDRLPPRDPDARDPDPAAFPELFRSLFDRSPSRRTTGGHHTAALSDGRTLLHVHEEVGRHNGADRAIGAGLLAGDPLPRLGLITTARISGEIAEKAARSGLAWVASRSVPTTLAVELARAADLPILARAASPEARILGPDRRPPDGAAGHAG